MGTPGFALRPSGAPSLELFPPGSPIRGARPLTCAPERLMLAGSELDGFLISYSQVVYNRASGATRSLSSCFSDLSSSFEGPDDHGAKKPGPKNAGVPFALVNARGCPRCVMRLCTFGCESG